MKLTFGPQERFFQGVGILAENSYPRWLSNALKVYCELPPRCKYVDVLKIADEWFNREDNWSRGIGIRLFYLLLIEPYRLIYNKFERNRKEVRRA
jgi:hypothetical protein